MESRVVVLPPSTGLGDRTVQSQEQRVRHDEDGAHRHQPSCP